MAVEANWSRLSGDFDGDGLGDLASVQVNSTSGYLTFPVFARSPLPDLLTKITDGNVAVTQVVQAPLTRDEVYTKGTATAPKIAMRAPLYVVKSVTRDSGNSLAPTSTTYAYTNALVEPAGRGFLGFATQKVTDPLGIVTTTTFSQTFPYIGMATNVTSMKGSTTLSSVTYTPDQKVITHASGKSSYFPFVVSSAASQYEYTYGSLVSQVSATNSMDTWGNPLSAAVTTTGDGNTYTQTITNTYFANTISASTWRIGELSQRTDRRTGPLPGGAISDITRTVAWTYDDAGLMETEVVEPANIPLKTTTTVTRDRFGNVQTSSVAGVDIVTRGESAVYDVSGRFATSKTNAEGHVTAPIVTDKRFGLPLSVKDANGTYSERQYDNFGRVIREQNKETVAGGAVLDGPYIDTAYLLCDTSCDTAQGETFIVRVTRQGVAPAHVYYDRNGRERRKVVKAMDGSDIITATEYDALGRVVRYSKPYFAGNPSIQWGGRAYDAVGRLSSETQPGARVTYYAYNARLNGVVNPKWQITQKISDALGRLITTNDATSKAQAFAYDAFGNVARSTDAKGNLIINQYDLLGRKTQQQDPDLGTWTYQYNTLGQLVWQQDAKNQITTFTYDKVGRPLTRAEPDLNSAWTWDTATKGIGKLAKLTGDNGFERTYSYDGFGRAVNTTTKKTIDPDAQTSGPDFVHSTTFDAAGRPESVTYPTGFGYKNVYDANGYLSEVRHKDSNAIYWRANTRDAEGHVTRETLGNGLVTDRKYKVDTSYLDTVQTGTLSGTTLTASVQNDAYGFDVIGNLTSRSIYFGSTSLTETFAYDNLNRVTTITPVNGTAKTAAYDEIGNITSRSDVGVYGYTGCGGTHRVCNIAGAVISSFTYDANGNLQAGNGRNLSWTSYNYPLQITQGTTTESFLYSPERERVRRISVEGGQTTTTVYLSPRIDLGGTFEKTRKPDGTTEYTHHLYAGSQVIGAVVTTAPIAANATLWSTDLSTAPTTANPNSTGITLPSATNDPNGLVTWEQEANGNGRLVLRNKTSTSETWPSFSAQRRDSASASVKAQFEFTTTVANSTRWLHVALINTGAWNTTDYRRFGVSLSGNSLNAIVYEGGVSTAGVSYGYYKYLGGAKDNTTYVAELESTAATSTLYVYEKGQARSDGFTYAIAQNWTAGKTTLNKFFWGQTTSGSSRTDNTTYLGNIRLESFTPTEPRYFHGDHLGSATAITDFTGKVIERLSYDTWGKRRSPDGSDDNLATVVWATDLTTAPTTADPNSVGITMPTTTEDPNGLIAWDNSTGNGRLSFAAKKTGTYTSSKVVGQRTYLSQKVIMRAEVTTSSTTGNGRYIDFGVQNNGARQGAGANYRAHSLWIRGNQAYATFVDGAVVSSYDGYLVGMSEGLSYSILDNTTYIAELETTVSSSTLYLYKKGEARAQGVRHSLSMDWKGASGALVRQMRAYGYGSPEDSDVPSVTYLDNLSETVVVIQNTLKGQATRHGFTLHEHLDSIGLVHMNGRVYDSLVGRFLSADPNVFYPENQQDFNRYSYVHNNPLSFVDPSGFALMPMSNTNMSNYVFQNTISQMEFGNMMARVERGSMNLGASNYALLNTSSSSSRPAVASNQHGGSSVTVGNGSGSSGSSLTGLPAASPRNKAGQSGGSTNVPTSAITGVGESRALTSGEQFLATSNGLNIKDVNRVDVFNKGFMGLEKEIIAPNGNIYIGTKNVVGLPWSEDYSLSSVDDQSVFLHEMVHVYQNRTLGCSMLTCMAPKRAVNSNYDYVIEPGRGFYDYGVEEQAAMIQDRFRLQNSLRHWRTNNSTLQQLQGVIPF